MVFKCAYRIPRLRADGSPGFIQVKAGDTPEEHGLDTADVDPGYFTESGIDLGELKDALDIAAVIRDMWANTPATTHAELWTTTGKPMVEEIERRLDKQITEVERDAAWKTFKDEVNSDAN